MSQIERRHKQGTAALFNRAASGYDRIGPRFFSHFGRRLVEHAQIPGGAKVLDVACGRGAALYPAAQRVASNGLAVGVDLSREMLCENAAEIRILRLKNIHLAQVDAEHLTFPDDSFDFVLCGLSIFFFPRLQQALTEMYRVLKIGGQVGLTTFAKDCKTSTWLTETFDRHLPIPTSVSSQSRQPTRQLLNTPEVLEEALRTAGFQKALILKEEADFVFANEEEWWSAMWIGRRHLLERLTLSALEEFKVNILRDLQVFRRSDGIHLPRRVLFALGSRP